MALKCDPEDNSGGKREEEEAQRKVSGRMIKLRNRDRAIYTELGWK